MTMLGGDPIRALREYLVGHGYPESAMAIEWPIGDLRVDLAVIDPDTNEPVALFEEKSRKSDATTTIGQKQLAAFARALGKTNIPAYLVFPAEGDPPFSVQKVELGEAGLLDGQAGSPTELVPPFAVLRTSRRKGLVREKKDERTEALDHFLIICWVLALVALTFVALEWLNLLYLSDNQLALVGVAAALVVLPYAGKLKVLGLEFERLSRQDRHKEE